MTTIGIIGTGDMGSAVGASLRRAGHRVITDLTDRVRAQHGDHVVRPSHRHAHATVGVPQREDQVDTHAGRCMHQPHHRDPAAGRRRREQPVLCIAGERQAHRLDRGRIEVGERKIHVLVVGEQAPVLDDGQQRAGHQVVGHAQLVEAPACGGQRGKHG